MSHDPRTSPSWLFRKSAAVSPESDAATTEHGERERRRRYAVFAGEGPPEGGWKDLARTFYTRQAALGYARRQIEAHEVDWAHVVDLVALEEVTSDD